jgi:thiamine phosphate synthase YjbQ (UPF0047 family)
MESQSDPPRRIRAVLALCLSPTELGPWQGIVLSVFDRAETPISSAALANEIWNAAGTKPPLKLLHMTVQGLHKRAKGDELLVKAGTARLNSGHTTPLYVITEKGREALEAFRRHNHDLGRFLSSTDPVVETNAYPKPADDQNKGYEHGASM